MMDSSKESHRLGGILIAVALFTCVLSSTGLENSGCDGPNRCIPASECRRRLTAHYGPDIREREKVLFNCGFEKLSLLVCCPPDPVTFAPEIIRSSPASTTTARPAVYTAPPTTRSTLSKGTTTTTSRSVHTTAKITHSTTKLSPITSTTVKPGQSTTRISQQTTARTSQSTPRTTSRVTSITTRAPSTTSRTTAETTVRVIIDNRHSLLEPVPLSTQRATTQPYHSTTDRTRPPPIDTRPTSTTQKFSYVDTSRLSSKPDPPLVTTGTLYHENITRPLPEVKGRPPPLTGAHGFSANRPSSYGGTDIHSHVDTDLVYQGPLPDVVFEEQQPAYTSHTVPFYGSHSGTHIGANPGPRPTPPNSNRPNILDMEVPPMRPTRMPPPVSPAAAHYQPPRRPFEPPYVLEGESSHQPPTRPTPRPPNLSSTYPGANAVGSGESGPLWPTPEHQKPQGILVPSVHEENDEDDLTRHPNYRLLPQDICGTTAAGPNRIINGQNVTLGEFPFMALLGYKTSDAAEDFVSFCGGTLISWKYVLTAAHCLKNSVRVVRLGEHVISTQPDCDHEGLCADPMVDVEIELKIPHPSYGKPYLKNDVGLIRLRQAQPRLFSSYIRPICLPLELQKPRPGRKLIVAGWGTTRRGLKSISDVLQMAVLPEVGQAECNDNQEDDILRPIVSTQMCVAVTEHFSTSCHGDSGGPVMDIQLGRGLRQHDDPVVVQLGIISVGSNDCGLHGAPSICTRVSSFTRWILDTMRD